MSAKFLTEKKPLKTLRTTKKRIDIDFERVSIVCALVLLTKTENVSIAQVALAMKIRYRTHRFAWNLTWN